MKAEDWTLELPQTPGHYLCWEPGPAALSVVEVVEVEPGFGWPIEDGKVLGMQGVSCPWLCQGDTVYWQPLEITFPILAPTVTAENP